ncbi:hypothetical protein IWX91DRAFT_342735 [Phyllosticta citricarpa]
MGTGCRLRRRKCFIVIVATSGLGVSSLPAHAQARRQLGTWLSSTFFASRQQATRDWLRDARSVLVWRLDFSGLGQGALPPWQPRRIFCFMTAAA